MNTWENKSLKNGKDEYWRPVRGYELIYAISNIGRVKSLDRLCNAKGNSKRKVIGKIISQHLDKDGYLICRLSISGVNKTHKVHRLVAIGFIPNHKKLPEVNHLFGIKTDNRSTQLEWCTKSRNAVHAFDVLGRKSWFRNKKGKLSPTSKSVHCLTNNKNYGSIREAERELGIDHSGISKICLGKLNSLKGYSFKYL